MESPCKMTLETTCLGCKHGASPGRPGFGALLPFSKDTLCKQECAYDAAIRRDVHRDLASSCATLLKPYDWFCQRRCEVLSNAVSCCVLSPRNASPRTALQGRWTRAAHALQARADRCSVFSQFSKSVRPWGFYGLERV